MRSRKTYINLLVNYLMQIVALLAGFIIPQLLLNTYGSEINGLTNSANQFLGYFALVEGGIGAASIIALYEPFAKANYEEIGNIYRRSENFFSRAGIVYALLVSVFAVVYGLCVKSSLSSPETILIILFIGIGRTIEFSFIEKYRILLVASQNIGVYAKTQLIGYILNIVTVIICVRLRATVVLIQIILAGIYLIRFVLVRMNCHKLFDDCIFKKDKSNKQFIVAQQGAALVHQIASLVAFNTDMVVLTIFTNLLQVSVYSVYAIVVNGITTILSVLQSVLTPAFGNVLANKEYDTLDRSFSIYTLVYYAITSVCTACTLLLIRPFIMLYTVNVNDVEYWNMLIAGMFIIIFMFNNFRLPGSVLINASGHLKQTQWFFVCEAAINLVISLILVKPLGIIGCLIGTAFSTIFRFVFVLLYPYYKVYKYDLKKVFYRIGYNTVICIGAWIGRNLLADTIHSWGMFFGCGLVVFVSVTFIEMIVVFVFDRKTALNALEYVILMIKGKR